MRLKVTWKHLLTFPLIMAVFWLCSLIFTDELKIAGLGALIVASAMFFILLAMVLVVVAMIGICFKSAAIVAVLIFLAALLVGGPILLLLNEIVNGFWICDIWIAFLVSTFGFLALAGYEVLISRKH